MRIIHCQNLLLHHEIVELSFRFQENDGNHPKALNFWGRLLLSKLKSQNSMTDTHLALTKSDSGFWKIEKTRKNEHKFLNLASMIMIRLRNEEWWTDGGMFQRISSIHTYTQYRYLGIHRGKLFIFFIIVNYEPTIFDHLDLNWEENNTNVFHRYIICNFCLDRILFGVTFDCNTYV